MDATQDKRLFLIDAYAMIFRGYYALIRNPRLTSKGVDTSAIFGFTNSLIELIRRERPTHLAVVFDVGQASVRTDDYADYKANRSETPEAIKVAIPYIHRILQAMHVPILGVEGYEADDVIGTIACKAEKEGYTTFMVTPDKDFAQLVTDKIKMYKPGLKGGDIEILGVEEVKAKYEIEDPKQVIDFLAMMGDAVDNIPGLDGVGEKTAMKFLKEFGSIENLLANTHQLKGKLKEKVEASAERGILSKKLATIICDAPIDFHQEQYDLDIPDFEKVKEVFDEIEFRRLYENLYRAFAPATETTVVTEVEVTISTETAQQKVAQAVGQLDLFATYEELDQATSTKSTIEHNDHLYQFVDNPKAQKILVQNLLKQKVVCFDTETTSLNELEAELVGMSFSYKKGLAYYIPLSEDQGEVLQTLEIFRPFFEKEDLLKIAHNLKFDYKILKQYDITVKGAMFDTMIAHYLLNPDGRHGMDYLSEVYLNYKPVSIETIIGKKGKNQGTFRDADLRTQTDYAAEDADITFQLYELFAPQLKKENLEDLFFNIEMPLMEVLAKMELAGISLDEKWLAQESIDLENDLRQLESKIFEFSGEEFNMNSPKQLGEVLFEKMQLDPKAKKTKTGQYATSEDVLQKLASKHEIIQHILEYRTYQKLKSTYVDALPSQIDKDERVHTNFSQTTAATGRLASVNPNLQNIPIRTLRGQQIRGAFVSAEGKKIISADYSQIELRLIAEISGEENMIKAFQNGEDIHASTAAKLFKVPLEEVSKTQRSQAKTVNFGIIYGQGAFALAEQTGLSRSEAKQMIEAYFETYPKLKEYMAEQVSKARQIGYVETILGRKRHLKDINSNNFVVRGHAERNAVNAPVQGSAADVVKMAMIKIQKELEKEKLQTKMLLQVHDELVFESPIDEVEVASNIIKIEMENAIETQVPLLVEIGVGNNWLEAH